MNRWVEVPRLAGYSGPYADESDFLNRWQTRLSDLKPLWIKAKNSQKLAFLPGGAGSVDRRSMRGAASGSIPSIFRGLPSWMMTSSW